VEQPPCGAALVLRLLVPTGGDCREPSSPLERLRLTRRERVPLSFDEALELVDAAREHSPKRFRSRNVAVVKVFFHCALRVAEVVSLNLDQVDFDNRLFLNVRTKGNKRLSILFNDVVAEALEAYLADRKQLGFPPRSTRCSCRTAAAG